MTSREPAELPLYHLVVIVRRGETNAYTLLSDKLSDPFQRTGIRPSVEVMWDRRRTERRAQVRPMAVDQRGGDRRQPVPETWTTSAFVVATVRR